MSSSDLIEIVIASGKGGVGKSTIAASLAIILRNSGYRVIAVDADAEAPNLHLVLGINRWDRVLEYREGRIGFIRDDKCIHCGYCYDSCAFSAIEEKSGRYVINPWICEGCYTCSFVCPVKAISFKYNVLAGYIKIAYNTPYKFPLVSSEIKPGRPNSGKLVTEAKNLGRTISGGKGLIIVDAAAGIGCQVIASLAGSQLALLVAEPTPASFSDLKRIHKLTKHFGIPSALIINMYNINNDLVGRIIEYARKENIELLGLLPYDYSVPKSMAMKKPVIHAYPSSEIAKSIIEVCNKLLTLLKDWENWRLKHIPEKIEPFIPVIIKPKELG